MLPGRRILPSDGKARPEPAPPSAVAVDEREPVVELAGVWRTYGVDPPVHALRDVSLRISPGEWLAIVGPSGSGKSTLLNVIGLLDRPTAGTYRLHGTDVAGYDDLTRAGLRARYLGFVFQAFHLLPHRSVLENVMLAELYRGKRRDGREERAAAALDRVGMSARAGFLPSRLSGGERQRAAIARALVGEPSVLLCDEPTGNLDSANSDAVLALFEQLSADGLTLAVITHDDHVAGFAKRQVRMVDGCLDDGCLP